MSEKVEKVFQVFNNDPYSPMNITGKFLMTPEHLSDLEKLLCGDIDPEFEQKLKDMHGRIKRAALSHNKEAESINFNL